MNQQTSKIKIVLLLFRIMIICLPFLCQVAVSLSASSSPQHKKEGQGDTHLMRVNRALRATHSRRQVNRFIDEGRLSVNDVIVLNSDDRLKAGDLVKLDDIIQVWEEHDLPQHRYIKFHKPAGVITTTDRRIPNNILDALEKAQQGNTITNNNTNNQQQEQQRRVYPVGRLDADSVGLIILTSDGSIVNPSLRTNSNKMKEYHAQTCPQATDSNIQDLMDGVVITTLARRNGLDRVPVTAKTLPCLVERIKIKNKKMIVDDGILNAATTNNNNSGRDDEQPFLRFVIQEGRNRQIRKMCSKVGLTVTHLHREEFAGITSKGVEIPGSWINMSNEELLLIGAKTREDFRTPEEKAIRKLKKLNNKRRKKAKKNEF